ncbi:MULTISPECIES: SSI family serine proteinase inhibitor [Streptomyces]|uniref:Protease inhibitor n=1 Tax=Streptomyces morookaense TaxID=1970 RepID=A0A7Y7B1Q1_STRMO|nr:MULTISPECIES: SSI family serine proteinase inhibitor [Streptomyces]MCC2278039.1 protease inhibitor [Streptomyces sp. ET3-23]NVK77413.1 protease inhibitor [Streptomyces morookaense]GHF21584.1 hypothetical protein GCM10010359_23900 [Streptomyces morookaense]
MSVCSAAAAAATATALLALPLVPASADEQEEGRLLLTVSGAEHSWIRGVRLGCPGAHGKHPHGAEACRDLIAAGGRPDALRGDPHPCTLEEDPVIATAQGEWHGQDIHWRKAFGNACVLDAATGPVFRF